MAGAQIRQAPDRRSATRTTTPSVTMPVTGAAASGAPAGASVSLSKMIGARLTGTSMSTVPATVGVNTRRNMAIFAPRKNCTIDDMTMSVASSAGPPSMIAVMLIGRKAAVLPMTRM